MSRVSFAYSLRFTVTHNVITTHQGVERWTVSPNRGGSSVNLPAKDTSLDVLVRNGLRIVKNPG